MWSCQKKNIEMKKVDDWTNGANGMKLQGRNWKKKKNNNNLQVVLFKICRPYHSRSHSHSQSDPYLNCCEYCVNSICHIGNLLTFTKSNFNWHADLYSLIFYSLMFYCIFGQLILLLSIESIYYSRNHLALYVWFILHKQWLLLKLQASRHFTRNIRMLRLIIFLSLQWRPHLNNAWTSVLEKELYISSTCRSTPNAIMQR